MDERCLGCWVLWHFKYCNANRLLQVFVASGLEQGWYHSCHLQSFITTDFKQTVTFFCIIRSGTVDFYRDNIHPYWYASGLVTTRLTMHLGILSSRFRNSLSCIINFTITSPLAPPKNYATRICQHRYTTFEMYSRSQRTLMPSFITSEALSFFYLYYLVVQNYGI